MRFLVRCLLWMLMAALPLQGSAALLAACHVPAPVATHGCHQAAAGDAGDASATAADAADAADAGIGEASPHGKCSTCASCCTAASAPPQAHVMPAPFPRAGRALPAAAPLMTAIYPSGLERPPRAV